MEELRTKGSLRGRLVDTGNSTNVKNTEERTQSAIIQMIP